MRSVPISIRAVHPLRAGHRLRRGEEIGTVPDGHRGDHAIHQPTWGDPRASATAVHPDRPVEVHRSVEGQRSTACQHSTQLRLPVIVHCAGNDLRNGRLENAVGSSEAIRSRSRELTALPVPRSYSIQADVSTRITGLWLASRRLAEPRSRAPTPSPRPPHASSAVLPGDVTPVPQPPSWSARCSGS